MRQRGRHLCGADTFADQHEILAAAKGWFSGGFETADPKAGKALLTNLADVGLWHKAEVAPASCDFRFRALSGHPMSAFLRSWSAIQRCPPQAEVLRRFV